VVPAVGEPDGRRLGILGLRVAGLLAGTDDQSRLEDVGEWIIDCEEGSELIARLEGTA
jgi:hypothetical protein